MQRKELDEVIGTALGGSDADFVLKNATYLNVFTQEFLKGDIAVKCGRFAGIGSYSCDNEIDMSGKTIVPGFIDGHIHLESSIIMPLRFAKEVIPHGTTAVVTDPHEITNILGSTGIDYMLQSTADMPMDVFFMVPSCIPATPFDESGEELSPETIAEYLGNERVLGLAEMMNYPGVVARDKATLDKIYAALSAGKIIDGHAPGLTGRSLAAYASTGVSSDHECSSFEEAVEKVRVGQWIMIRQGTAGKNLEALVPLLYGASWRRCIFATDDKHPGDLCDEGHIDFIVRKAIEYGTPLPVAYTVASFNAAQYFGLKNRGAIAPGYIADFSVVSDIESVSIDSVYKNGRKVAEGEILEWIKVEVDEGIIRRVGQTVNVKSATPADFAISKPKEHIIQLVPGQIITKDAGMASGVDLEQDIVKVAVVERHRATGHIGKAYLKGYGLKSGAVATSIAHDSHNIIVAGTNDEDMAFAVQRIIEMHGGMVVVNGQKVVAELALPIAGLMCDLSVRKAKQKIAEVKAAALELGVNKEIDPLMTLSFVSLPVIPSLKLTTFGLVDVDNFRLLDD